MEATNRLHAVLDSKGMRWIFLILLVLIVAFLSAKIGFVALLIQFLQKFDRWAQVQMTIVATISLIVNFVLAGCIFFLLRRKIQQ